jgi:hypothetical protein
MPFLTSVLPRRFQDAFMHGVRDLVRAIFLMGVVMELSFISSGVQETLNCLCYHIPPHKVCTMVSAALYLAYITLESDGQLFVIPFAKSASTGQHSPVCVFNGSASCASQIIVPG